MDSILKHYVPTAGESGRSQFNNRIQFFFPFQFEKPGRRQNFDYPQMVKESVTKALADAKINYTDIQQACCGYVSGIRRLTNYDNNLS